MIKRTKMDTIFYLTILSGILTVILSGITYYNGKQKEMAADISNTKLLDRTEQVANLQSNLVSEMAKTQEKSDTIISLQNKLQGANDKIISQNEKISELNEFIAASVTGGETFPYISVLFASTPRGLILFNLMSEGENPLYDIGVNIIDNDRAKELISKIQNLTDDDYKQWITSLHINNFRPHEVQEIGKFMISSTEAERNFTVELIARNGYFKQQIKILKKDNSFKVESEVRKGDKVLKKL